MTDMGQADTGRRGVVVGSIRSALACVGGFGNMLPRLKYLDLPVMRFTMIPRAIQS